MQYAYRLAPLAICVVLYNKFTWFVLLIAAFGLVSPTGLYFTPKICISPPKLYLTPQFVFHPPAPLKGG